jgi:putative transposase
MVSASVRLHQAQFAQERGVGFRRACALMGVSRSSVYYRHRMPCKDEAVVKAMMELSGKNPRYGARRIRVLLKRQGMIIGKTRCRRLWTEAGLQVPRKKRRRISASGFRTPHPKAMNSVWSYDFVHDMCANGQKLKCLTVVDEYTRECLAIEVSGRIRSFDVIETLSRLMSTHGIPCYLRSDNGPEFVSGALLEWATKSGIDIAFIEPGKPWQNGLNESFNGKFRDECLSAEWFRNRLEAKVVIEDWRQHYNAIRPHSSLNYCTPIEFKNSIGALNNPGVEASR